jgi:hypothetical protein
MTAVQKTAPKAHEMTLKQKMNGVLDLFLKVRTQCSQHVDILSRIFA